MLQYPQGFKNIPCPVEKFVTLLGSKWSILIVKELTDKNDSMRFNELLKVLKPISSRTLSAKLKELANYDVVSREIIPTTPVGVQYSLTEKGKDLTEVIKSMAKWSQRWHGE